MSSTFVFSVSFSVFPFLAGELIEVSGQQFINQWIRPHFWFILYADAYTCNSTEPPPVYEALEYEMIFLNPGSGGNASDHFGDDLRGKLLTCTVIL